MLRLFLVAVCVLVGSARQSEAGTIANVIQNNVLTRLSDNSLEFHVTNLGNGNYALPGDTGYTPQVNVGDALFTIARIDQVSSPFGSPDVLFGDGGWTDELTIVSLIEVADKVDMGGNEGFRYTFQPFSGATDPLGLGWSEGTMAAFYSDPSNDYTGSPGSIAEGFAQASNGSRWWEFGMLGGGVDYSGLGAFSSNALGEYWTATTGSDFITDLAAADPSTSLGSFQIGLHLIERNNGLQLVAVNAAGLEFTGGGNLLGSGGEPVPGGFQLFNDLNFSIQAVPEPSSVAVWSLLGVAGVVGVHRRRRLAKAHTQA